MGDPKRVPHFDARHVDDFALPGGPSAAATRHQQRLVCSFSLGYLFDDLGYPIGQCRYGESCDSMRQLFDV